MSLPSSTDVLIVGAGPTGLATALSLLHYGPADRRITIVDALPNAQNDSRALVIHSHTLELLEIIGASSKLIDMGLTSQQNVIQNLSRVLIQADYRKFETKTRFPFILLISQADTEAVLTEILNEKGGKILRGIRVTGMQELPASQEGGYKFNVTTEGGSSILTKYIVGCDGGKSPIRHLSNIPFSTPKLSPSPIWRSLYSMRKTPDLFALGDVIFDPSTLPPEGLPTTTTVTLVPTGFFLFSPTTSTTGQGKHATTTADTSGKGKINLYRLAFYISDDQEPFVKAAANDRTYTAYFQGIFDKNFRVHSKSSSSSIKTTPRITEIVWASTFRIHYAVAPTRYKLFPNGGTVLIAGDAAHIHSPAGGQGMNMGICDGIEAGKALNTYISSSDRDVLEKHSTRRTQVAITTIQMTAQFGWVATITNPIGRWVRDTVLWMLGRFEVVRTGFAWQLSGLSQLKDE